ncbi:MAG: ATP-binding protein [Bacteroidetes bacterium]|nr:ATP-binding protein [Bacteroidota bacterium]
MTNPAPHVGDSAVAVPTKQFFVSMLTRDISLADAILDLVDNSLDGALRLASGNPVDYSKHRVEIVLDAGNFSIEDNCGGIPREIARNYAFKMGREPDDDRDSESETIGMYGVGMKRAIFKMGEDSLVQTLHEDDAFEVSITSAWLGAKGWDPLPIEPPPKEREPLREPGTRISVSSLYPSVARHFANAAFQNELRTSIAEHFTLFLQQGMEITVNGAKVDPVHVEVLMSENPEGPVPFVFQKTIDGVTVSITVGLNTGRSIVENEDEETDFEYDRSSATAGWTVFCNDRAVIVGDKSRLTGWGDGVPLYHNQFAIITGIVEFRSTRAERLPVTTTKRALDTSSDVWLEALVEMKKGLRVWIDYTNEWKNHPRAEQSVHWKDARPVALSEAVDAVVERHPTAQKNGYIEFDPKRRGLVPTPPDKKPSSRRIVFSRTIEDVRAVSQMLFDMPDKKPGIVGDRCFSIVLAEAQKQEG